VQHIVLALPVLETVMELKEIGTISNLSTSRIRDLDKAGPLCTTATAAEQLGISPSTLHVWQRVGKGPRFLRLRIGSKDALLYSMVDLQEFALAELRDRGVLQQGVR
jgi:hypothetical protein